jgi:Domain of unknown function (DUF397)
MPGHVVRDDAEGSDRRWRKSSRSYGSGECVEVAAPSGKRIVVRDSKNVQGTVLMFSSAQWNAFVAGIRNGRVGRARRGAPGPKASTAPTRSSVSHQDVTLGNVSLYTVGPVVAEMARLVSAYGRWFLPSFPSYA